MSRSAHGYTMTGRFRLVTMSETEEQIAEKYLEWVEGRVWLSKEVQCRRATLRGVPAKRIDLLVDRRIYDHIDAPGQVRVIETGIKAGRFDAAERDRITVRYMPEHQALELRPAMLHVHSEAGSVLVEVIDPEERDKTFRRRYEQLRSDVDRYDPQRLISWHLNRYFRHLLRPEHREDTEQVVAAYEIPGECPTLAEANRHASRTLYRLSRDLGWRKLTRREREKLGIDGGPWHREEDVSRWRSSGCGDATHNAACSGSWG